MVRERVKFISDMVNWRFEVRDALRGADTVYVRNEAYGIPKSRKRAATYFHLRSTQA